MSLIPVYGLPFSQHPPLRSSPPSQSFAPYFMRNNSSLTATTSAGACRNPYKPNPVPPALTCPGAEGTKRVQGGTTFKVYCTRAVRIYRTGLQIMLGQLCDSVPGIASADACMVSSGFLFTIRCLDFESWLKLCRALAKMCCDAKVSGYVLSLIFCFPGVRISILCHHIPSME
jgi:hypothetical protein